MSGRNVARSFVRIFFLDTHTSYGHVVRRNDAVTKLQVRTFSTAVITLFTFFYLFSNVWRSVTSSAWTFHILPVLPT